MPHRLFTEFFESEKAGGLILMLCTVLSLCIANSFFGDAYIHFWEKAVIGKPFHFWINDGLMTVFFLLVGLEIEREIYAGELAGLKKAMLPVVAALGGMLLPATIHFAFNKGTVFQAGMGIPTATDIAFSLGVLSLLGKRVPTSLKIFLVALAIMDDVGAVIVIAVFYSKKIHVIFLLIAASVFILMLFLNRMKVHRISVYLGLGIVMWYCLFRSGIHPAISGVLLAFALPFEKGDETSASYRLQKRLHLPVAFFILPVFALANTAILLPSTWTSALMNSNSAGIIAGLVVGKPLGIFLFTTISIQVGICKLPDDLRKKHIVGAGLLAGIGFTMSIFISLLAFDVEEYIAFSKIAVLVASVISGILGLCWLHWTLGKSNSDDRAS